MEPGDHALTPEESRLLDRYSGTRPNHVAAEQAADAIRAATAALLTSSLAIDQVAALLDVPIAQVHRLNREGHLYALPFPTGEALRFPAWQFIDGQSVPHVGTIANALPAGSPLAVRAFFENGAVEGSDHDAPWPSVAEWLLSGGSIDPVLALVEVERRGG